MMQALARLPLARLTQSPRALLPMAFWSALAILVAFTERRAGAPTGGTDRVLLGGFGSLAVPLLAFAVVSATLSGDSLQRAIRPIVALGASPSRAVLAHVLTAMLASAALAGVLGILVVLIAGSPHLAADIVSTFWIAFLGAGCYAAWFSLGATFGRRGAGRATFLIIDYILGATSHGTASTLALFTPRGNVHSLLGGAAPSDISQRASSVALVLLAAACILLTLRRARR